MIHVSRVGKTHRQKEPFDFFELEPGPRQPAAKPPAGHEARRAEWGPGGSSFSLFQVKARKKEVKKLRFCHEVSKNNEP